jgi:CRISPR-associated protein Csd1
MLEMLEEYFQTNKLPPPGLKPKIVRWAIVCDSQGRFQDVVELGDAGQRRNRGQEFPACPDLAHHELIAGGEAKSHFLVETAAVIALIGDKADKNKAKAKHDFFIKMLRDAGGVMPELRHLADRLADEETKALLRQRLNERKVKPNEKVTFQINGAFPIKSDAWHGWWQHFRYSLASNGEQTTQPMICFVTGKPVKPARTHPKIEGLADVGGSPMGTVLVGFDKDAFTSYGFEQSANAAVSEEAAYAYRAALNDLIAKHSQRLAGSKVVHWFKKEVQPKDDPLAWLEESADTKGSNAQHRASELLRSISDGKRPDLAGNYYYALILSGSGGRVMVRDWIEGRFEGLVRNVGLWFDDLAIVSRDGGRLAPDPKFLAVLGSTARDLKDLPAPFVTKMWRVAVHGEPIPQQGLAQAFARAKMDIIKNESSNHARMGLMRAYYVRQDRSKGVESDMKPYLNEEHPSPAYQCGRLMAVLAGLQQAALGDVGAGVVQRFFAAASVTPALVLGRLLCTGQFHLDKLKPGLAYWYNQKIGSIAAQLKDNFPVTLTLEEQSLFALGYYQQWADLKTGKSDDNK